MSWRRPLLPGLALPWLVLLFASCTSGSSLFVTAPLQEGTLVVDPVQQVIQLGTTHPFTATLVTPEGSKRDVTLEVTWDSSDGAVATIDAKGVASGRAPGRVTISASLGELRSEASLSVNDQEILQLAVYPPQALTLVGLERTLRAFAVFEDGHFQEVTADATWSTSDAAVATVAPGGAATGVAQGRAVLSAELEGARGEANLVVLEAAPQALRIEPLDSSLAAGTGQSMRGLLELENGTLLDVTEECSWRSSDSAVAIVDDSPERKGVVLARATGDVRISDGLTIAGQELSAEAGLTVTDALITELIIIPPRMSVPAGTVGTLQAVAYYSDGTSQDVTREAAWTSSDRQVVHVVPQGDMAGDAVALKKGTATVTAQLGSESAEAAVQVNDASLQALVVTPPQETLPAGSVGRLRAEGHFSDGSVLDVSALCSWTSSDPAVAQVINSGPLAGSGVALAPGTTTVTARFEELSDTSTITVTDAELRSVTISPQDVGLPVGAQQRFLATAHYSDRTARDVTTLASWTSSDEAVASVVGLGSQGGLASALAEGTATLQAVFEGQSGGAVLTVRAAELDALAVVPQEETTGILIPVQYTATGHYTDGSSADLTRLVTWHSSDSRVAYVDPLGVARGLSAGTTAISAEYTGLNAVVSLEVTEPTYDRLEIRPREQSLPAGTYRAFEATAFYRNGQQWLSFDVTTQAAWLSSKPEVASVASVGAAAGILKGLEVGETELSASFRDKQDATAVTVTEGVLERIQVIPLDETLPPGVHTQYAALGIYTDGSHEDITLEAVWSSTDTAVASISPSGRAMARTPGTASIEAALDGKVGGAPITVADLSIVNFWIEPATLTLPLDAQQQLRSHAVYSDADGNPYEVDVTSDSSWRSMADDVVSVVASGADAGQITALDTGKTRVHAEFFPSGPGGSISNSSEVTVVGALLEGIVVDPARASIAAGTTQGYTATGIYSDASSADLTHLVTWTSSDNAVASPDDDDPVLVGHSPGSVTVTATLGHVAGEAGLTVTDAVPEEVYIQPAFLTVPAGTVESLRLEARMSDGTFADLTSEAIWSSDDDSVMAVVAAGPLAGLVQARGQGTTEINARWQNLEARAASVTVTAAELSGLLVLPQTVTVPAGLPLLYGASGLYSDGSQRDVTDQVLWASSDPGTAWIGQDGRAVGVKDGTVQITATWDGIQDSAQLTIDGSFISSLLVEPAEAELPAGSSRLYRATAVLAEGRKINVTAACSWTSTDPAVASVNPAPDADTVHVVGLREGHSEIVARLTLGAITSEARGQLQVQEPQLIEVVVTTEDPIIQGGASSQFHAQAVYDNGISLSVTDSATWASSDLDVASVSSIDNPGLTYGVGAGSADISATFAGQSGQAPLRVIQAPLLAVLVIPGRVSSLPGDDVDFSAFAVYADAHAEDVTREAAWSSSDDSVAVVGPAGRAEAVAQGQAVITAAFQGKSGRGFMTVEPLATNLVVVPASASIAKFSSLAFRAEVSLGGVIQDVTDESVWSSSNTDVALVRNDAGHHGEAYGIRPGTASITAQYTSNDGQKLSAFGSLTVSDVAVEPGRVEVTPRDDTMDVGENQQYTLTGYWQVGAVELEVDLTRDFNTTWSVTGGAVTISNVPGSKGVATAVQFGDSLVRAEYRGVGDQTSVMVGSECGSNPPPTGSCPNAACDSCQDGVCTIECHGSQECKDKTVNCPDGLACVVECTGSEACSGNAVINCPDAHQCTVLCEADKACEGNTVINCPQTDGTCSVVCAGDEACKGNTEVECGAKLCLVSCDNGERPGVSCPPDSCACYDACP